MDGAQISQLQSLIKKIPVADNVTEYVVKLVAKTRPNTEYAHEKVNQFVELGSRTKSFSVSCDWSKVSCCN